MKVRTLLCVCALLFSLTVAAQFQPERYPKREFRAAWIQAVNGQFRGIPTEKLKQTLIGQLNSLQEAGINAIIFQVRPEADALYASQLEPWSRFLTGVQGQAPNPYWDPMEFMIEECHKRGMEFHAWINPYRVKTSLKNELAPGHVYNIHPEWFVTYGDQVYFDPALPESRRHICMVITDIVSRYDVDAIHMDDYFYPYPKQGVDFPDDASFARYGGGFSNKADWRRSNVNVLIKKIHETVRELKPWVKFGVSPFGIYRNQKSDPLGSKTNGLQNYDDLYADVLLWAREGWIDYNIPQIYWQIGHPVADYETLVKWWAKNTENRPLFIGQSVMNTVQNADPQTPSMNQLPRKMALQRAYQTIGGSCQWPASAVVENAGKYRTVPVMISGSTHMPPQPYLIEKQMEDFIIKFQQMEKEKIHPVLIATYLHDELVRIHPFIDGNGRTSRLLMNLYLLRNGYTLITLKGSNEAKISYYRALEKSHTENKPEDFRKLVAEAEKESLLRYLTIME